ncbi:filamentous hemagglutinin N-terminal domain-containing protein [cf. Phormidesmis sp. LEGE 11477]|uniref:two-partner secretion domain-containing protein n=1 Tax=cf. Phormidesmis sp. LEGE 11477 TaxID=1828680 RepID=UPI00187EB1B8|nr:filamentous hemagglutinin N-terminal domain-containing protein [cf. Phormidesmis sp. LEGE 11477]MBE9063759.1 filamentous hemagglutinin N-terminal domain-containing protein [cf. Phormidesmis sp. LEGE 11477]
MQPIVLNYLVKIAQVGSVATVVALGSVEGVRSQSIVPDSTLGIETSIVDSGIVNGNAVQLIEGGAKRGGNLFHSFVDFNVGVEESVYFASPSEISNILSRITGNNLSTIDGVLGVDGTANLFLLNPNGILFGPDAQLDIPGSFTASAANSFAFADSSEFSAMSEDTSLLSISVPLGIQLNDTAEGDIASTGTLETGQNLSLLGNQLQLGGKLAAGGDITLQAEEITNNNGLRVSAAGSVVLSDYVGGALKVETGGSIDTEDITTIGPNTTLSADGTDSDEDLLLSGRAVVLRTIGENAARSGINVNSINTSNSEGGDGGAIIISSTSGDITTQGSLNSSSYSDSDDSGNGGAISISSTSGDITTQGSLDSSSGSSLFQYDSGSGGAISISSTSGDIITQGSLDSSSGLSLGPFYGNSGNGGAISIYSTSGDITTQGILDSSSGLDGDSENGGAISISSTSGNITIQKIHSFSQSSYNGDSGNGGAIHISSTSGNITIQEIRSFSSSRFGGSGSGGAIRIYSTSGDITTQGSLDSSSFSSSGNSGSGGAIRIYSTSGDITTQESLNSSTRDSGSGGAIRIYSTSGNITTQGSLDSSSGDSGSGGAISISSISGDITTQESLNSSSSLTYGDSGNGGAISISSISGDAIIGGNINTFSFSENGNTQTGGDISITSQQGNIRGVIRDDGNPSLISVSVTKNGQQQIGRNIEGGNVTLKGTTISNFFILTTSDSGSSGRVMIQGSGDRSTVSNLSAVTSAQVEIPDPFSSEEVISLNLENVGQSGNTTIESEGNITLRNIDIQSDANGNSPAGDVTISSPGQITFDNTQISSNANADGAAGNISIDAVRLIMGEGDRLSAATSAAGRGGNITIDTTESVLLGEGVQTTEPIISVETSASSRPGNIIINTPNFVLSEAAEITATSTSTATNLDGGGSIFLNANQMELAGTVGIFAETQGQAPGGVLTLQPYQANLGVDPSASQSGTSNPGIESGTSFDLRLTSDARISAATRGRGSGGDLRLIASDAIAISGPGRLQVETENTGQAGSITATARSLRLVDGVTLSASTAGSGAAGNVNFNLSESLTIDGSTVESLTKADSEGAGGNINISGTSQVTLLNSGSFVLNSNGAGSGGDLILSADTLTLNNSQITATTRSSDGGDFTFNLTDYLLLREGSLISTEAGTDRAGGNGGSITINMPDGFIIAVPDENSDIRANAFQGDGGNVNITANNLLGIAFRPGLRDTPKSDITSSSQFGNSGTVTINELNPNTLQTEAELPVDPVSATVAPGCRAQGSQSGSFVITGRGGVPSSPAVLLSASAIWQDLAPLEASPNLGSNHSEVGQLVTSVSTEAPVVEAQSWHRSADGTITLLTQQAESLSHLSPLGGC